MAAAAGGITMRRTTVPAPYNEPMRSYAPGTDDAAKVAAAVEKMKSECPEVPCIVGGEEIKTGSVKDQTLPHDHGHKLCTYHQADDATLDKAVAAAAAGKKTWMAMSFEQRAAVFLKAADLLSGKYRYEMLAATMLGQGKTVWQAEIDAIAETADFLRFNISFAQDILGMQPPENAKGVWNWTDWRPLEGFIVAISPFNFTAIGANLPTSPAMMGNTVLWKPASTAIRSNYLFMKILEESGLPAGVINFVPGSGAVLGAKLFNHPDCAGLHFTGSTETFNNISIQMAQNVKDGLYKNYPRIVGETGGKDFHFVHNSWDNMATLVNGTIRAGFEYQGQKCSACSRVFIPQSQADEFKERLCTEIKKITQGPTDDPKNFMSAVIDRPAFDSIKGYIDGAKEDPNCEIVAGGGCDDSKGYFVQPTVIWCKSTEVKVMKEEIFGPVISVFAYPDDEVEKYLEICDQGSPYGLTGSIFSKDRSFIDHAMDKLRYAAGNLYINDKCTGSVVGQQPFGGSRLSGTNDKAGSNLNLLRWCSPRSVKESMVYLEEGWAYPHMG